MKKRIFIKKYIVFLFGLIFIFLCVFFSINYVVNNNYYYMNNLIKDIRDNYVSDSDIESVNIYGGYYIVLYGNDVVVLDKDYKEIYKEDRAKLCDNEKGYDIVYKTNKLMYEETIIKKNKIVYKYYDVYDYKYINSITLK